MAENSQPKVKNRSVNMTPAQRETAREMVARLHTQGLGQAEIARRVGAAIGRYVSQPTVHEIIGSLWDEYRRRAEVRAGLPELMEEKLEQLRRTRAEAWDAWEASKADAVRETDELAPPRTKGGGDAGPAPAPPTKGGRAGKGGPPTKGGSGPGSPILQETAGAGGSPVGADLVRLRRVVVREGRLPDSAYLAVVVKTIEQECKLLGLGLAAETRLAVKVEAAGAGQVWREFVAPPPEYLPAGYAPPDPLPLPASAAVYVPREGVEVEVVDSPEDDE